MQNESQENNERPVGKSKKVTPLPKMQIFILLLVMIAEPISSTVIYPFVNQFVKDTGITGGDDRKVGHYAGFLESVFFFAECTTVFQWGRLSDQIGRRPVLLLGPIGLAISLFTFGLSNSFWVLLIARCAQGAFNGNMGVTKTMMFEMTDHTNIAQAYAWHPVMWSSGITLGPLIGGIFALPVRRWPELANTAHFLVTHPYFLPCAITGGLSIISLAIAYIGLKETLPSKLPSRDDDPENEVSESAKASIRTRSAESEFSDSDEESPLLQDQRPRQYGANDTDSAPEATSSTSEVEAEPEVPLKDLLTRPLLVALANHGFLCFLDQAHQALLPLMYSTSIDLGGLGLRPDQIGLIMGVWGACNAVFQVTCFPKLMAMLGPRKLYIRCFAALLVTFSAFPILNCLARWPACPEAAIWLTICCQMTFYTFLFMGYGCTQLFIMDAAPTRNTLGAVNGLGQMMSSVARTVAPSFASSLFSISLQKQLLGGHFVYILLLSITIVGVYMSNQLPSGMRDRT
ncbi:hypothetical protein D9756_003027 [Leucocoprinus leucothites]|uniref:Major facilitator superfamily (MFS) profile domain-containing protein n=1 Tax=Leucocoprinus leucothites TaxID=201217 RepID=A0A8H5G7J0_9AGAR|nr:hypothetical protein D9756_003027 [Leucoagaricus leucothites]